MYFAEFLRLAGGGAALQELVRHDALAMGRVEQLIADENYNLGSAVLAALDKRAAAHPDKFKVYYVVDKSSSWFWRGGVGYVTDSMLKEQIPAPSDSSMVYVCGPPPMYKAICGPKKFEKGKPPKQGPIDGVLKALGYTEAMCFKF